MILSRALLSRGHAVRRVMKLAARPVSSYENIISMNETQQTMKEMARDFAQEHIAPYADQIDREDKFDIGLWRKLGDQGLLGITAPEEYGGAGLGYFEHCLVSEEISRASGSVGLSYIAHSNL